MSYAFLGYGTTPTPPSPPPEPVAHEMTTGEGIFIGGIVIAIIGLAAWGIYTNYKIASSIAEKEGSSGVLKYEAGTAAIGLVGEALRRPSYRENRRSKRKPFSRNAEGGWIFPALMVAGAIAAFSIWSKKKDLPGAPPPPPPTGKDGSVSEVQPDSHGVIHLVPGDMGHVTVKRHLDWTVPGGVVSITSNDTNVLDPMQMLDPNALTMGASSPSFKPGNVVVTFTWKANQGDKSLKTTILHVTFLEGM